MPPLPGEYPNTVAKKGRTHFAAEAVVLGQKFNTNNLVITAL